MLAQLRRLLPYLHRYRFRYAVGALCVFAAVGLRMLIPHLLGDSIDALRDADDASSDAEAGRWRSLILRSAALMVGAAALGAVTRTVSRLMVLGNSRRAIHDVRRDVFARLLELSPSFYVRHQTGHIMSRCVNDMQNVQGLLGPVFLYLVETAVLYAVGLAFMLQTDAWLTLLALLPFPIFLVAAQRLAQRVQHGSRAAQEKLGEVSAKVDESLSGHKIIKSLALEDHDAVRFRALSHDYSDTVITVSRIRAWLASVMVFLAALSSFLVLAFGAPRVRAGDTTVGDLVALVFYVGLLAAPTRTLGFVLSSLQRGAAALGRIGELLDMPGTLRNPRADGATSLDRGRLEVRNLSVEFAPPAELPHLSGSLPQDAPAVARRVLDDVSFTVPAGQTLGVVGAVGSGKTTLLRAIARQVEIAPGQVFIDDRDILELPLADVRAAVAMVPQDSFLFSETLADNVRFGRPGASDEAVMDAIRVAKLDRDLEQLPKGTATMLGERGVNLSGGQRQRASLARAVLLRPTLLLLDDTLSAIDTDTADAILADLRPIMAGRTTVIVAHRVSTVQHADQILVLEEGRIRERGTHAELVQADGTYAALHRQQTAPNTTGDRPNGASKH
ncbi:MAG: ABC transporter ATP-binding protein [Planctomycetota bacterium]